METIGAFFFNLLNLYNMSKRNPIGHWTKELCIEAAAKFKTRSEFKNAYGGTHTIREKPEKYWTIEQCIEVASKLKRRS